MLVDDFSAAIVKEFTAACMHYWEAYFLGDQKGRYDYFRLLIVLRKIAETSPDDRLPVKLCELTYEIKREIERKF